MNGLMTTDEVCEAFIAAGDSVADQSCIPRAVFWERLYEALSMRGPSGMEAVATSETAQ